VHVRGELTAYSTKRIGRIQSKKGAFIHIGFSWPVAVLLTLPFYSVAVRLGPVLAGPVHSCVGAAGRSAAVCCVRGEGGPRDKLIIIGMQKDTKRYLVAQLSRMRDRVNSIS